MRRRRRKRRRRKKKMRRRRIMRRRRNRRRRMRRRRGKVHGLAQKARPLGNLKGLMMPHKAPACKTDSKNSRDHQCCDVW
jgi:hypothetical protein